MWPDGQRIEALSAPLMASTHFDDHPLYHADLAATILEMERDPAWRDWIFKGGCGMKVRRPDRWGHAAADLIHGRALRFAHRVLSQHDVYTDDCWASVYRDGQYCLPHSHLRSNVSIVYLLDAGDPDPDDPMAGKLVFADPRIPYCCPHEPGRVTGLLSPDMRAGDDDRLRERLRAHRGPVSRRAAAYDNVMECDDRAPAGRRRRELSLMHRNARSPPSGLEYDRSEAVPTSPLHCNIG